jgi:predicted  nucleic acid-binding Zn-ribbon protein
MELKENIRVVIQLQDCDNRIQVILKKKNETPLMIKALEDELKSVEMKLGEEDNLLETLKKDRRSVEQEVQDLENKIAKSNEKLSHIKSNKEYTAALKEIEDLKNIINQTEDKVIQLMEEIEEAEKRCRANKVKQKDLKKDFETKKQEIAIELESLEKDLKNLEREREQLSQAIDQDLLKRYLFLRERKGGQAISPVIGGICRTCNIGLPPQKYNELKRSETLLACPNCQRMIYYVEEEGGMLEQDK